MNSMNQSNQTEHNNSNYLGTITKLVIPSRITLPASMRKRLGISKLSAVEMFLNSIDEIKLCPVGQNKQGNIGIFRKITRNGQVTIPSYYCQRVGLHPGDDVEIFMTTDNEIIIKIVK